MVTTILAFFRKPLGWAVGAIVLVLVAWWLVATLTGGKRAQVEARLGKNTTEAALQSGQDAVTTVGEQNASEAASDALTGQNGQDIAKAPGADATVTPELSAAGKAALCKRKAYRDTPQCK